jgi:hypothetical protein
MANALLNSCRLRLSVEHVYVLYEPVSGMCKVGTSLNPASRAAQIGRYCARRAAAAA